MVITIGVNNFPSESAEEIVAGIKAILQNTKKKFPYSKIMLFGPLPAGTEADSKQRKKYRAIHERISILSFKKRMSYHEVSQLFVTSDGSLYSEGGIHLKPEGYRVWAKYLSQKLKS